MTCAFSPPDPESLPPPTGTLTPIPTPPPLDVELLCEVPPGAPPTGPAPPPLEDLWLDPPPLENPPKPRLKDEPPLFFFGSGARLSIAATRPGPSMMSTYLPG